MSSVKKVILVGNLGRDLGIRYMPPGDAIAEMAYSDYRLSRTSAIFKKKQVHAGPKTKQQVTATAGSTTGSDAPSTTDGSGSGDDDGGDGDGDSEGPRRPPQSNSSSPPSRSTRAHRRRHLPIPLSRRALAWLLALALLLAYLGPPSFALLFVKLGHPELASEMLRYKPVLLLPAPPGWSKSD